MKNRLMAVGVALFCSIQIGTADTSFSWFDITGSVTPSLPVNRTVLTYISNDTTVGLTQPSGTPFLSSYQSGDDNFFMAAATIIAPDMYFTDYLTNVGDGFVGKYAYAVVVDLDFGSYSGLGSIPNGTKWGVSALSDKIVKVNTEPVTPAQDFTGGPINLIPEPASVALLVMGGAAAYWQRRRNRR